MLLPYPKQPSIVELVRPRRERLTVKEAVIPEDPTFFEIRRSFRSSMATAPVAT